MTFHMFVDIMFKIIILVLIVLAHKVFKGGKDKWITNKRN